MLGWPRSPGITKPIVYRDLRTVQNTAPHMSPICRVQGGRNGATAIEEGSLSDIVPFMAEPAGGRRKSVHRVKLTTA
jgi:hypothetical protein